MDSSTGQESAGPSNFDVSQYSKQLLGAIMGTVKAGSSLLQSSDAFDLYSSFPGFRTFYNKQGARITSCVNSFLTHQGIRCLPMQRSSSIDVEDRYERIVEANDVMLEQISTLLDSAAKSSKNDAPISAETAVKESQVATMSLPKPITSSWNRHTKSGRKRAFKLFHAQNISRPQTKFKDKIDNSNVPFVPKITHKPNAIKPLSKALVDLNSQAQDGDIPLAIANLVRRGREYNAEEQNIYAHPYEAELHTLKFMESQLQHVEPQKYDPFPQTPCEVITAIGDLLHCVEHLKSCSEFAVDLEAHTYRTFQGITCLMQISSRSKDFLIDTLELRSEIYRFNEVFTDPKIVKVLHGADSDIHWLQRDFGVYVVNMFDTGQAARELGLAHYSLGYLLEKYCDVHADKKYQLADWRIRPIPEEMRKYAQEDTHYLLYVYDVMRNELLGGAVDQVPGSETERILKVLNKSRELCLRAYEKFLLSPTSHLQLYERRRTKKQLNEKQLELLKLLFNWRDVMARQEDESPGYVLPKHMLFQIAEIMPREAQGVLACCNPVPPLVHQHVHTIHQLVLEARARSFSKKSSDKQATEHIKTPVPALPEVQDYDDLLSCPHDLSHFGAAPNAPHMHPAPLVSATEWSSFISSRPSAAARQRILCKLQQTRWDPFMKYFDPTRNTTRPRKPAETVTSLDNLALRTMLDPRYAWQLRNLHTETQEKQEPKKAIKQPDAKEDVIILSRLPQMQGQKRRSPPPPEKKLSRQERKKAKKLANSDFQPYQYQKSHYDRFKK